MQSHAAMNVRVGIATPSQRSTAHLRSSASAAVRRVCRAPVKVQCTLMQNGAADGQLNSKWPKGIPPQMGGHLMPSGQYAPLSNSSGCATGPPHLYQYHDTETNTSVRVFQNQQAASGGLAMMIAEASAKAIAERGIFTIAITGKESTQALTQLSLAVKASDFANWHVFFAGEQCVPFSSLESNYKWAQDFFLSKIPIPPTQVHTIEEGTDPNMAAQLYEAKLRYMPQMARKVGPFPVFDIVLLEVGERGEVASLYPNKPTLMNVESCVVPVLDAPVEPRQRVSFSLPLLNAAAHVMVVALGVHKRDTVSRALECQALPGAMPVQMLRPTNGELSYLLDADSASGLSTGAWTDWKKWPRSDLPKK
mmetsp:Transcript_19712/g.43084  ORF Transcript_19712/g.43084 Transcript_19712/m.43084 type:complete len:365 (-) Transcript_19712:592-1686(-)